MKEYAPANIRNIAIVGHQDSGKTMLAEAMLFATGATNRLGRIEDGNTTMDFSSDEIERQISVHSGVAWCDHAGSKINIIDTPGYEDFVGDVVLSLDVVDAAVVALRGDGGVEVGTSKVAEFAFARELPILFLINKLDKEHAKFDDCVAQIHETFGRKARVFSLPIGQGDGFRGVVDLVSGKAYEYAGDGSAAKSVEVPAEMQGRVDELRTELIETAAESSETLMEKYLDAGELTDDEFREGLAASVRARDVYPILCAAPAKGIGVDLVLDAIVSFFPTAEVGRRKSGDDEITVDPSAKASAYVFKNTSDSHVGDMLFFRVYGGRLEAGADIHNTTRNSGERLGQLYVVQGKKRDDVPTIQAGDIGAVVKLKSTKVRDTLADKSSGVDFVQTALPRPSIFAAIVPAKDGDDDKVGTGMNRLHDEDPTFEIRHDGEVHQTLISGQGELHLEVVTKRLKERFGVDVVMSKPRIPYRETITKAAEAQGRHKKQTGGRGQFGDVWLKLEPMARGEQFEFVNAIVGGVVPGKFIPAVEKGVVETMARGVVAGYQMVDIRVTLYDGSFHTVDSSEQAFKMAAAIAFKAAITKANAVLLEPIMDVVVKVPEEFMGDIMGDLSGRRGKIQGTDAVGRFTVVRAQVPQSELYRYSTHLRSMTQGQGSHTREFSHYEQVPRDQQTKIVEEAHKETDSK